MIKSQHVYPDLDNMNRMLTELSISPIKSKKRKTYIAIKRITATTNAVAKNYFPGGKASTFKITV